MADDPQAETLAALHRQVAALEQQLAAAETSRAAARAAELAVQARFALDQRLADEALLLALAAARAAAPLEQPPLAVAQIVRRVLEQLPPQRSLTDRSDGGIRFAWHPDSRVLAVSTGSSTTTPNQVLLWDLEAGTRQVRLTGDDSPWGSRRETDAAQPGGDLRGVDPRDYLWDIDLLHWSPDGRTLLIGRSDGTALLWDPGAAAPHRALPGPQLATVSRPVDDESELYAPLVAAGGEMHTGRPALQWQIRSLAWSDDGARLLIVYEARDWPRWWLEAYAVRLWDGATGALLAEMVFDEPDIACVAASPDAQAIAVGDRAGRIRILAAATGDLRRELMSSTEWVAALAWSPDSTRIVSCDAPLPEEQYSIPPRTQIWDSRSGALVEDLFGAIPWQPWSPDGKYVITIEAGAVLRVWDGATGASVSRQADLGWSSSSQVTWSPDAEVLLVQSSAGVSLWEMPWIEELGRLVEGPQRIYEVAWSPDGRWLAGADGVTVRVYNLARWQPAGPLPASRPPIFKHFPPARVFGANWTAAGPRLVVRSARDEPRQIQAWNLAGPLGPPLALKEEAAYKVLRVCWHPQGRTALLGLATQDELEQSRREIGLSCFGRLMHWEIATGATRVFHIGEPFVAAQWSPDGNRYALLAADGAVQIRAAATDALLEQLPANGPGQHQICWSPDGSALLRVHISSTVEHSDAGEQHRRVLATVHGAQRLRWELRLAHRWHVHGAGWGPGGPLLLVGHPVPDGGAVWERDIHSGLTMWNLVQGAVQWQTINPVLASRQVTWSPDGRQILLNSGTMHAVIAAATGAVLQIFESNVVGEITWDEQGTPVDCWSPDSRELFSFPPEAEWEPGRRCQFVVARELLEAELTRRACERLSDSVGAANADAHLRAVIPGWQGSNAELAAVAEHLADYDRICAAGTGAGLSDGGA